MKNLIIAILLLTTSCTVETKLTGDTHFKVINGNAADLDAVEMAILQLQMVIPYLLTVGTGDSSNDTWNIYFNVPCNTYVVPDTKLCVHSDAASNWKAQATWLRPGSNAELVAHELGHVVGLYTDGTHPDTGVMADPAREIEFTAEELEMIKNVYRN